MNRNIYGTIHVNMQMFDVDFPMVQLTLAKAMHETTIHSSVSCQKITFYEADQMDKSLRCKIKSEWEEREEVKKKHRGKNVCKQDCNRCQISRRCEN